MEPRLAESPASRPALTPPPQSKSPALLFGVAIFSSAFLLFGVEPLIAKIILPWFGGAAAVWIVCLLFFQVVLLLGYAYAHLLIRIFSPRVQSFIHVAFLAASFFVLPILPRASWKPSGAEDPAFRILLILSFTVGLPYFLLSSTSPLLQAWYARTHPGKAPYRFYSISNIGSMLALLSYPFLVEPLFLLSRQAVGWSLAYAAVAILCSAVAIFSRSAAAEREISEAASRPTAKAKFLWIALPACSSALLLAVTNHIMQNIAAVPFLWIIPLSLYLLSFILCFAERALYRRGLFLRLLGVSLGGMAYALSPSFAGLPLSALIGLNCAGLFFCCMFSHGELVRIKPHPAHLTSFYFMISLGGAMGAAFVALLVPRVFSGFFEFPVILGAFAILVLLVNHRDSTSEFYKARSKTRWLVLGGLTLALIASLSLTVRDEVAHNRLMARNFYGVLRVVDETAPNIVLVRGADEKQLGEDPRYRKLMNGTIDHGLQFLSPSRRREPTTYYGPDSGIGVALRSAAEQGPLRVGVIGLGAGTLAAYGRAGDRYTFYEINPLVVQIANQEFTFLRDSPAQINIEPGDARLSLEREPPQGFDVLAVDAFSGDAIPVHLLTREAFELYFRELKPSGVLAVHISNKFLDLEPVVKAAAASLGKEAALVNTDVTKTGSGIYAAAWILVASRPVFVAQPILEKAGSAIPPSPREQLWTDNYSSLFRVLR
ncbi:MAG: fused MFS/spermidine synthase [Candidatus Acidiferrales bacterium]